MSKCRKHTRLRDFEKLSKVRQHKDGCELPPPKPKDVPDMCYGPQRTLTNEVCKEVRLGVPQSSNWGETHVAQNTHRVFGTSCTHQTASKDSCRIVTLRHHAPSHLTHIGGHW